MGANVKLNIISKMESDDDVVLPTSKDVATVMSIIESTRNIFFDINIYRMQKSSKYLRIRM